MREILFRGKSVERPHKGQWIEGSLVTLDDTHTFIVPRFESASTLSNDFIVSSTMEDVDPSTVSQYTGLNDRNGKRIFAGDIVRYTFDSPDDPIATENGLKPRIGRIFWSEWRASFAVTAGRNGSSALNNDVALYVRGRSIYEYVRGANTVEVIGNIHDNPELMEDCT